MDSGSIQMERIAFVSIDIYMYKYQLKQNRRIINDGLLKIYILFTRGAGTAYLSGAPDFTPSF
jgi:hypothetical protein